MLMQGCWVTDITGYIAKLAIYFYMITLYEIIQCIIAEINEFDNYLNNNKLCNTMKKHFFTFIILSSILLGQASFAQRSGVGLSTSMQTTGSSLQIPIWIGDKAQLAPAIGFTWAEKLGTDLHLGLAARFYSKSEGFSPYVGVSAGIATYFPYEEGETTIETEAYHDFIFGLNFGAEYFFGENFSIGVEAQGNFTVSDEISWRFGNPGGTNFNLATALRASVYF